MIGSAQPDLHQRSCLSGHPRHSTRPLSQPPSRGKNPCFDRLCLSICRAKRLPNQAETVFNPVDSADQVIARLPVSDVATKSYSDVDYLAVGPLLLLRRRPN